MMTAPGSTRAVLSVLVVVVLAALLGWFYVGRRPGTGLVTPPPGPVTSAPESPAAAAPPAPTGGGASPRAIGDAAPANRDAPAAAAATSPQVAAVPAPVVPSFDVVRIEPDGSSVVAGRAAPGAQIELKRNGQVLARAVADSSGAFALVPPPLDPGPHDLTLDAVVPDGTRTMSAQSVTAVIAPNRIDRPLVTVTAPDRPTAVLSQPEPPRAVASVAPGAGAAGTEPSARGASPMPSTAGAPQTAGSSASQPSPNASAAAPRPPLRIATVESQGDGQMFVSGEATPGSTLRLYLNDTLIARGATGADGKLSFSIGRGVRPGDYRVRLDEVDPATGAVRSRVEVPFTVPAPAVVAAAPPPRLDPAPSNTPAPPSAAVPASPLPAPSPEPAPAPPAATLTLSAPRPADSGAPPRGPAAVPSAPMPRPSDAPTVPAAPAPTPAPAGAGAAVARQEPSPRPPLGDPGRVVVPEVATSIVSRGDSLWRISQRVYGRGLRYTVIYDANAPQIRNPDLIYPGQVFVLPPQ